MVKKKGKSKRTTLQDKYKIKKRTAETARKRKKQANRDAAAGVKKHKSTSTKDPGIPNSWPFKADLLKEIQRTRERQQELQAKAKEERATNLRALREHQAQGGTARTVEQLLAQAQQSQADFAAKEAFMSETDPSESRRDNSVATGQQSRRAYLRELRKVIDGSDVILQVLDARDPMNSRIHPKIEDMIRARPDKKMVLLLNKIDLVPKPVVQAWLTHLRRSVPALAVRADKIVERKTAKKNNGQDDGDDDAMSVAVSTATSSKANDVLGMEGLLQLLKNYARVHGKQKTKTTITVGIIGYPNVGKSSIINALKRTRAVGVSPRPGFTTCAQEVVLDRDVRLMDCPGVVFDDEAAWLGNCLNVDTLADPIPAVEKLLERCDQKSLLMTYKIPAFPAGDVMMFLAMVARSHGRVLKGGVPDKVAAARSVLKDWNEGKIPYFTAPPVDTGKHKSTDAVIVSEFAADFDALDAAVLTSIKDEKDEMDFVQLTAQPVQRAEWRGFDDDDDDDDANDDEEMDEGSESEQEEKTPSLAKRRQQLAKAEDYDFNDL